MALHLDATKNTNNQKFFTILVFIETNEYRSGFVRIVFTEPSIFDGNGTKGCG